MDLQNEVRVFVTVVGFILFVGICFWAFSKRNKADFDEDAQSVISDDDLPPSDNQNPSDKQN